MTLRILDVDPQGEVALALLREAVIDVGPLYRGDLADTLPLPKNFPLGARDVYIAAWLDDVPVGCGSIRELNQSIGEIQRMYVHRDYRRRHYGRCILLYLEGEAKRLGYTRLQLETGNRQAPAMALYEASGFRRIPPFGRYVDDPTSVCFERHLSTNPDVVPTA
jgi:GNAT superfamily N-acetyltransferase